MLSLLIMLLLLQPFFVLADAANGFTVTSYEVAWDYSSTLPANAEQWTPFRLDVKFEIDPAAAETGETVVVKLPDNLVFNDGIAMDFPICDETQTEPYPVVANAHINLSAKTVTLTYTGYVDDGTIVSKISGYFYFYVLIDSSEAAESEMITFGLTIDSKPTTPTNTLGIEFTPGKDDPDEVLGKWGDKYFNEVQPNLPYIRYVLRVNMSATTLKNAVISDRINDDGMIYIDPASIEVWTGTVTYSSYLWEWLSGSQTKVTLDPTEGTGNLKLIYSTVDTGEVIGFDFKPIDGNGQYYILYKAYIVGEPTDEYRFINHASLVNEGKATENRYDSIKFTYGAGGGASAVRNNSLTIVKVDSADAGVFLPDAKFKVVRVDGDNEILVVPSATTNSEGKLLIDKIGAGTYRIYELEAPAGYTAPDSTKKVWEGEVGGAAAKDVEVVIKNSKPVNPPKNDDKDDDDDTPPATDKPEPSIPPVEVIYDAALQKWVYRINDGDVYSAPHTEKPTVRRGNKVTFAIRVINQCDEMLRIPAISDYMPSGYTFDSADNAVWTQAGSTITYRPAAPIELAPKGDESGNDTATIFITLTVGNALTTDSLRNYAEISELTDENDVPVADVDSLPDSNANNDGTAVDNEINEHGAPSDEDDHDFAEVIPHVPQTDNRLVIDDDGEIFEIDENGTPLGTWTWDEEEEIWIFDEIPPLAAATPPPTGGLGSPPRTEDEIMGYWISGMLALYVIAVLINKQKRFYHSR